MHQRIAKAILRIRDYLFDLHNLLGVSSFRFFQSAYVLYLFSVVLLQVANILQQLANGALLEARGVQEGLTRLAAALRSDGGGGAC